MASLNKCMAEEFSAEKTYAIENLVVYNDKLYVCTNSEYVAGEFSLDNFEETTLADVMSLGSLLDNSIAPTYDNTATYKVDDIVEYGKKLYKCVTAVESVEEFDSGKWAQTYMTQEFGGYVNSNLGKITHKNCGSGKSFNINVDWNKNDKVYILIINGVSVTSTSYNEFGYIDKNNNKVVISSDWTSQLLPTSCISTITNTGITLNFQVSNDISIISILDE